MNNRIFLIKYNLKVARTYLYARSGDVFQSRFSARIKDLSITDFYDFCHPY